MKRILFLVFFVNGYFAFCQPDSIQVIPKPVEVQYLNGKFLLTPDASISFNEKEVQSVAEMLAMKLQAPTGFQINAEKGLKGTIQLNLNKKADATIGDEGYVLESSPQGIMISANKPAGIFYGVQTLLQLFPKEIESPVKVQAPWSIPALKITDYPRFAWRGLMLDVSRHFFTKEEVEKYIDIMSAYKFNTFHWHLTDENGWRIEIKSLPKLTEIGACRVPRTGTFGEFDPPEPGEKATDCGYYTQEDIKEVVQYAKERFVTILPEIDVPGHSLAAIASYPYLSCSKDTSVRVNPGARYFHWNADSTKRIWHRIDNTLNPSDERVYDFLD